MFWQNLVFAFIAPIVLATIVAALIVGIGMTLLGFAAIDDHSPLGAAFGSITGLHGHDIGKGLAVLVALIISSLILVGASAVSRFGPPGPRAH